MQTVLLSLVVVAVAAVAASPVVEESRHQKELREHYHHLSYIAEYSCHHPQARTVPVHELLSPYQTRGKAFFPEYTVLHRCDMFAGCCEGAMKCGPLHADNVNLPFKVTFLEDMGDKHKGEWDMEYISFDNHTVCGCVDKHGLYTPEEHYSSGGKDHQKHEDHDSKDHQKHENHDGKDHYLDEYPSQKDRYDEDKDHKYSNSAKEQSPSIKDSIRKDQSKPDEDKYQNRPDKKEDRKIDSVYISI